MVHSSGRHPGHEIPGIYIPLEVFEIAAHVSRLRVLALVLNVAIVTYLLYVRLTGSRKPDQLREQGLVSDGYVH